MKRLAHQLRRLADRIDREGAPKATGLTMGMVDHVGLVVEWGGPGCPLWYLHDRDYQRVWAPGVGGVIIEQAPIRRP